MEGIMIRGTKEEESLNSKDEFIQPDNIALKFCKNGRLEDESEHLTQEEKDKQEKLFQKILNENLAKKSEKKQAVKRKIREKEIEEKEHVEKNKRERKNLIERMANLKEKELVNQNMKMAKITNFFKKPQTEPTEEVERDEVHTQEWIEQARKRRQIALGTKTIHRKESRWKKSMKVRGTKQNIMTKQTLHKILRS